VRHSRSIRFSHTWKRYYYYDRACSSTARSLERCPWIFLKKIVCSRRPGGSPADRSPPYYQFPVTLCFHFQDACHGCRGGAFYLNGGSGSVKGRQRLGGNVSREGAQPEELPTRFGTSGRRASSVACLMDSKPVTDVHVCVRMHPRLEHQYQSPGARFP